MAASAFDSALFSDLFPTGEVARLWTDTAELRAMLLVEGTLAQVQGRLGTIPEISAKAIARAAMEVQLDPAALAAPTGRNGVSVPGVVAAFRAAMNAPEHAQYVHWGATSQDIIDTGMMLRLRQTLALMEADLSGLLERLAELAETHAALPMAGRTYGQHATPTSFGAVAAAWGAPLLELRGELGALRAGSLWVSLSGAAGTSAALGPQAAEMRAGLAEGLGLGDPGRSWHTDRGPILRIAGWANRLALALAKIGEDATELAQSGIGEVRLEGAGGSSTMPQKQNPVGPSVVVALARLNAGLFATLQAASIHRHQRDGASWFTEWLCLPQAMLSAASALQTARAVAEALRPDPERMAAVLEQTGGAILAEALSFALAGTMPRPEAQAEVKRLVREVQASGRPLAVLAREAHPQADLEAVFDPSRQLGSAPADARAFARAVRAGD